MGFLHPTALVNTLDLLPCVDYDVARGRWEALAANPGTRICALGCRTGEGLER